MKYILCLVINIACLATGLSRSLPDARNPNLEYELVNVAPYDGPKRNVTALAPMTPPATTHVLNTPPPVDPNSKSFAYDAKSRTWTLIKRTDPQPDDDTLVWNQSNDKWLTQTPRA